MPSGVSTQSEQSCGVHCTRSVERLAETVNEQHGNHIIVCIFLSIYPHITPAIIPLILP